MAQLLLIEIKDNEMFGNKAESGITETAIRQALSTVQEPELHRDLVSLNMVRDITISGKSVGFTIMLTTPACPLRSVMEQDSIAAIRKMVPGVENVQVRFDAQVRADNRPAHLDYLKANLDRLMIAGPLLADDGVTVQGSLLVIEAADRAAAEAFAAGDPYAKAGLFESVTIKAFKKVLP